MHGYTAIVKGRRQGTRCNSPDWSGLVICSVPDCNGEAVTVYEGYSLCEGCLTRTYDIQREVIRMKHTYNEPRWFRKLYQNLPPEMPSMTNEEMEEYFKIVGMRG